MGTSAYPNIVKTTEDLFSKLKFRVDAEEVPHPGGRVLVFHIPSRPTGHPYHLDGTYLMRSGESLVAMSADQLQKIFSERPSGRPTVAYIISALILGLIILIAMKYWPSHNPRQDDAEIKSVETDASRNKTDSTGHESKEEPKSPPSKPEAKAGRKPKDIPRRVINPSKSEADVEALLVIPRNLSIASKNISTEIAWDIKHEAILWNLDEERNNTQETVLSLPQYAETFKGDFLKPGAGFLPRGILGAAKTSGRVKKGDRLFGFAVVTCSNCPHNRAYWIYYIYETSGWYSPLPVGQTPALEVLSKNILIVSQSPEYFFQDVPVSNRKPILDFHSN